MKKITFFITLFSFVLGSYAQDLSITEIMYNPSNPDGAWEWVEVYNAGTEIIDLSGYVIDDASGATYTKANIPSGSIMSGESAILFNASALSEADFLQVWGNVDLIPVTRWSALNNGGDTIGIWNSFESYSGDNVAQENVIEQVTYDDDGQVWPTDNGVASIYLTNLASDNTVGTNWSLSAEGAITPLFKAYLSQFFEDRSNRDIASPGLPSLEDNEQPIIVCLANIDIPTDTNICGAIFSLPLPTGSDNATEELIFNAIRSDGLALTEMFSVGSTTITWTAVDQAGNVSEPCEQIVLVSDTIPPSITCSEIIEVTTVDGSPVSIQVDLPVTSDICDGIVAINSLRSDDKPLEDPFPVGQTIITWEAFDSEGNKATCEQIVAVSFSASTANDITSFTIPNQIESAIIDNENKTVTVVVPFGSVIETLIPVIEISEGATISPDSGIAQNFSIPVNYDITAESGTAQNWLVTVTIEEDNTNPIIECLDDIVVQNDAGECGAVVEFAISFSDEDAEAKLIVSIESGSVFPVGTNEVIAIATDSSGNITNCAFNVIVEDVSMPILVCKAASVQLNSEGIGTILVTDVYETISDNCEIASVNASKLSFSETDLGANDVTVIAVDINGNSTSCTAVVSVLPFEQVEFSVTSFTLINADTNEDLFELENGMRINTSDLSTLNLAIRANTSDEVESVGLTLTGRQTTSRIENVAPYTLFGDSPAENYNGNIFIVGSYGLSATPFSKDNLKGDIGETLTLDFEFYEEPAIAVTAFMLVNADTNEDLFLIKEGMKIDLNKLPTLRLDIRANTSQTVESVRLKLEGSMAISRTENIQPYALYGDLPTGNYNGIEFTKGFYKISAVPYELDRLAGEKGAVLSVDFELVDLRPPLSIINFTLIDSDTNTAIMSLSDGMQIELSSLPSLNLNIRANTTDDIESVSFQLSGSQRASRTENVAPYALFGDFPKNNYVDHSFVKGSYTITAVAYSADKLKGEMGKPFAISFEFVDLELSGKQANQMKVYPNPASSQATLQFKSTTAIMVIYLYDLLGRTVEVYDGKQVTNEGDYILDVDAIPEGLYYIKAFDADGNEYQKQVLIQK